MRIENAINEIRGQQKVELRSLSKKQGSESINADSFELTPTGKVLSQTNVNDVRQAKIEQAKQRVRDGYYDQPEVLEAIADAIMDSGAVDSVAKDLQRFRSTVKAIGETPDIREDKLVEVRERIQRGFYDLPVIKDQIAQRVSTHLIG